MARQVRTIKSSTAIVNWEVYQSNDKELEIIWSNSDDKIPYDLSAYTACFEISKDGDSIQLDSPLTTKLGDAIDTGVALTGGGTIGEPNIIIVLSKFLHGSIPAGEYDYGLKLTDANNKSITKLAGKYTILESLTHCA